MLKRFIWLCVFLVEALIIPGQSHALIMGARTNKVSADIITAADELQPQQNMELLVKLKMQDGWHIYWNNPGDAGLATTVSWDIPEGYDIKLIEQSVPEKYVVDGLVQYGYADTAYWKYRLEPVGKQTKTAGVQNFRANISWMACKDECVPENVKIDLSLPIAYRSDSFSAVWQDEALNAEKSFPLKKKIEAYYTVGEGSLLINTPTGDENFINGVKEIVFIPNQSDIIVNNGTQKVGFDNQGNLSLLIPLEDEQVEAVDGLLAIRGNNGGKAYKIWPERAQNLTEYPAVNFENDSLLLIMLMAFIGGIILNFMPCIFPILSLKAIALVQGAYNRRNARIEALIYMFGVVVSFLVTASVLIWLRRQGEQIGWGFQLQSPAFVSVMIVIFFIVFLMLMDLVNFRNPFANRVGRISFAKQKLNAFFTGFFAVLIASPCTAPFMGIAIGYTLAKPVYICYPVFLALSLGYALPFMLIGFFPEVLARFLPKPGRWMGVLKKIFAIPVLLTCFWLAWVLGHLASQEQPNNEVVRWQAYDEQKISSLLQQNKAVFIDFTAKWCLTCLANDKIALDTGHFAELVKKRQINLFKADWTNKDAHIAAALEHYGRNSIPLYVYYGTGKDAPVILPQLLTPGIVEKYLQ